MFSRKSFFRILSILFTIMLLLTGIQPVEAAISPTSGHIADTEGTAALLQFTAGGHILGFGTDGMYAATGSHALRVEFVGARTVKPQVDAPSSTNNNVKPLDRVTYTGLWKGITLSYTAEAGSIYKTTYTLSPGADVKDIRLHYNAPIRVDENGILEIDFETTALTESAPIAWQVIDGRRVNVDVDFCVHGQEVGFAVGTYNAAFPLMIDPTLTWTTFLGGNRVDDGGFIAVDSNDNIYVGGSSSETWGSPVQAYTSSPDAFVAKLDPYGNLVWNTFLGGSGIDVSESIAVDINGNIYVGGNSDATWGTPIRTHSAGYDVDGNAFFDAFVAKLDSGGNLIWNTFLGSNKWEWGCSITVDGSGYVYVGGSSDATWGNPVRAYTASNDAFAAKLDSSGNLIWNTFLGGNSGDSAISVAVDESSNMYVAGDSQSTWGSPVRTFTPGNSEAFAAKLDSSGNLTWNTFLGGSSVDDGDSIAVDDSGNVYVGGGSYATWGNPIRAYTSSEEDIFVAKLNPSGVLAWNTFLGGNNFDFDASISINGSGGLYVAGNSASSWGNPERAYTSKCDVFVAELDSSGDLVWNTFLGANGNDLAGSIALGSWKIYMGGYSVETWGTAKRPYTSREDVFVASVISSPPSIIRVNPSPTDLTSIDFKVTFSKSVTGVDMVGPQFDDFALATSPDISSASITEVSGSGNTYTVKVDTGGGTGTIRLDIPDTATITDLSGSPLPNLPFTNGEVYTITTAIPFSSVAANDGWTLESSEYSSRANARSASGNLIIGDNAKNRQYRSLLYFDTSSLPDNAVVTSATLKIMQADVTGTDPFTTHGILFAEMKNGIFGKSLLENTDFQAVAYPKRSVGNFVPVSGEPGWYELVLNPANFKYVNLKGVTQFRIRFTKDDDNDKLADFVSFYSGDDLTNPPQLIVEYTTP